MNQKVSVVIGRGFGDEGKGLATDWLCSKNRDSIVVKHNGGAQAGHTVDRADGSRFVFHELGAGSFRHADTFWADSYYPDLYKLKEEIDEFSSLSGFVPNIYADYNACVTIIFDVLVNHSIETIRGDNRHGSCGMGINEADLRTKAGYGISMAELSKMKVDDLVDKMLLIRREYYAKRLAELGIKELPVGYKELFESEDVLFNSAKAMLDNMSYVKLTGAQDILPKRSNVVFETGQGLLLDGCLEEYFPYVTASRTGLTNPVRIVSDCGISITEVLYVARSYVTRHGEGPLSHTVPRELIGNVSEDRTNQDNPWQGAIRYALYDSIDDFLKPIIRDLTPYDNIFNKSVLFTHLNETGGMIKTSKGDISIERFKESTDVLNDIYCSYTPLSEDIK